MTSVDRVRERDPGIGKSYISGRVNRRQVTTARSRMGIKKAQGRGANRVKRNKENE